MRVLTSNPDGRSGRIIDRTMATGPPGARPGHGLADHAAVVARADQPNEIFPKRDRPMEHEGTLLEAVGALSGGRRRGPFTAKAGSRRARGVAMASPFGSEVSFRSDITTLN
jgi:hypothetical protein